MHRDLEIKEAAIKYAKFTDNMLKNCIWQAFIDGAKWADCNPIIKKEMLEKQISDIESGYSKTLCEYSGDKEKLKAFNDGQISALKLLLNWVNFVKNENPKHDCDASTNSLPKDFIFDICEKFKKSTYENNS